MSFNQIRQRQPNSKKNRKQPSSVPTLIPSSLRTSNDPNRVCIASYPIGHEDGIPAGIDPTLTYDLRRSPPLSRSPVASISSSRELYPSMITCPPTVLSTVPTESYRALSPIFQAADITPIPTPFPSFQNPYSSGVPVQFAPSTNVSQSVTYQPSLSYDMTGKDSIRDRRSVLLDTTGGASVTNLVDEVKPITADIVACLRMDSSDRVPDPEHDIPLMDTVKSEVKVVERE